MTLVKFLGYGGAILIAAPLLLWPAVLNGYPLLFGDTGVYLKDGIDLHVSWPRPMFYGLFMRPLHSMQTTWPVIIVQALITAIVLLVTMRAFLPKLSPLALIPITLLLTVSTSLPWVVSQLMPDLFAGLLLLTLSTLVMVPARASALGQVVAIVFSAACIIMHLSLLSISLALIVVLLGCRWLIARVITIQDIARAIAVPVLAVCVLIGTNVVFVGQPSVSPYGKIFLLNRILVDGPGVRALQRDCPREDWTLCAFKDEIPTIVDEDDMLWGETAVLERAGGYEVVARQAWPIILSALRAEPGTIMWQALSNTAIQFISFRSGDALRRRSTFNEEVWSAVFPQAEQARYHAGRQHAGLELISMGLQAVHVIVGAVSIVIVGAGTVTALRGRAVIGGLLAAITIGLVVNAFVTGALWGVYDHYQSRFVWLEPFALLASIVWHRQSTASRAGLPFDR